MACCYEGQKGIFGKQFILFISIKTIQTSRNKIRVILNLQQWQRARRQREGVQPQYRFLFKQSFSSH